MAASRKRTSTSATKALDAWAKDLEAFRVAHGFDLSEPVGFSRLLLATYGPQSVEGDFDTLTDSEKAAEKYGFSTSKQYKDVFVAWVRAMAPHGMIAARGLHSLGFLPGDDIASFLFSRRNPEEDNFSQNVAYAAFHFATFYVAGGWPRVTKSWARAAATLDSQAERAVGVQVRDNKPERQGPCWANLSPKVRKAILRSQCPVVVVAKLDPLNMRGWGGDSESGPVMEAEVKVAPCEPACVERLFVASAVHKLGKPVSAEMRRHYALDEHKEIVGRDDSWFVRPPTLYLHPDTPVRARLVKNLPEGWTWYEVDV